MIKMGTTTVKPAGIARVYVGDVLVYSKDSTNGTNSFTNTSSDT